MEPGTVSRQGFFFCHETFCILAGGLRALQGADSGRVGVKLREQIRLEDGNYDSTALMQFSITSFRSSSRIEVCVWPLTCS
jgi:hypothetical protein